MIANSSVSTHLRGWWETEADRVKDRVQRKEYFIAFYQGRISDAELERSISNTIHNAYKEAVSGGWLDKDNEKKFLNTLFCDLTTGTVQLAVSSVCLISRH